MHKFSVKTCLLLSIFGLNLAIPSFVSATVIQDSKRDVVNVQEGSLIPTGKGWAKKSNQTPKITGNLNVPHNGIYYHGGKVMGTTSQTLPNIYYIWYGNWAGSTAINLLTNLAMGIGKTPYYNINTSYTDANGIPVIRAANFPKPGVFDAYSQGTALSDSGIYYIIKAAITNQKLPLDPNGIYFVLTSADVNLTSGFCTSYCGWHTSSTLNNTRIQYAFVGNPDRCPRSCSAQTTSPNDNPGADGMASVIAHEIEEAVTDPQFNAWYDNQGYENADKCAWQFGATKTAPNGSKYNMTIAFKNYLIQMNWLNVSGGKCANFL